MSFIIEGPTVDGELLYWSNNYGWADRESATIFDDRSINMPLEYSGILETEGATL